MKINLAIFPPQYFATAFGENVSLAKISHHMVHDRLCFLLCVLNDKIKGSILVSEHLVSN